MNKKATLGTIFTWVPAFLLISLIMVVFVIATTELFLVKDVDNKIDVGKSASSLDYHGRLISILNYPVEVEGKKIDVYGLIKLWSLDENEYKGVLGNEIKSVLDNFEGEFFYKLSLQKKGFRHNQLIDIVSENYKGNPKVFIEGKPELAGIHVFVSEAKTVYVVLRASQGEIKEEKNE